MTEVEQPLVKLSREEIHAYVKAFLKDLQTSNTILAKAKILCDANPSKQTEDELIDLYEEAQAVFFANLFNERAKDDEKAENEKAKEEIGTAIVQALHTAVEDYPDEETEALITKMCVSIESHIRFLKHDTQSSSSSSVPFSSNLNPSSSFTPPFTGPGGDQAMKEKLDRMLEKMKAGMPPSSEDIRDATLMQMHMASYMQSMNPPQGGGKAPRML